MGTGEEGPGLGSSVIVFLLEKKSTSGKGANVQDEEPHSMSVFYV